MLNRLLLCLLLWNVSQGRAQSLMSQIPLQGSGILSKEFTGSWSYSGDLKSPDAKKNSTYEYCLYTLFRTGKVISGDPLSLYMDQVWNKIRERDGAIKAVKWYVLRSEMPVSLAHPNAGYILMSEGWFARCENAEQLAFAMLKAYYFIEKKEYPDNFYLPLVEKVGVLNYRNLSETPIWFQGYSAKQKDACVIFGMEKIVRSGLSPKRISAWIKKLSNNPHLFEYQDIDIKNVMPWWKDSVPTILKSNFHPFFNDISFTIDLWMNKQTNLEDGNLDLGNMETFYPIRLLALAEVSRMALLQKKYIESLIWSLGGLSYSKKDRCFQWLSALSLVNILKNSSWPILNPSGFAEGDSSNAAKKLILQIEKLNQHPITYMLATFRLGLEMISNPETKKQGEVLASIVGNLLYTQAKVRPEFLSSNPITPEARNFQKQPLELVKKSKYSRFYIQPYGVLPTADVWGWFDAFQSVLNIYIKEKEQDIVNPQLSGTIMMFTPLYAVLNIQQRSLKLTHERMEERRIWLEEEARDLAGMNQWKLKRANGYGMRASDIALLNQTILLSDFMMETELNPSADAIITRFDMDRLVNDQKVKYLLDYSVIRFTGMPGRQAETHDGIDMDGYPPIPVIAVVTGLKMVAKSKETWIGLRLIDLETHKIVYTKEIQIPSHDRKDLISGHLFQIFKHVPIQ